MTLLLAPVGQDVVQVISRSGPPDSLTSARELGASCSGANNRITMRGNLFGPKSGYGVAVRLH